MLVIKPSLILIFSIALISCGGGSAESVAPAPNLTVINTGEFDYDRDWNIELNATGLDSASVAYSIDNLPSWMTLDSVSGLLSGEGGIPGDYRLVAKATDAKGASASTTFDLSFTLNLTGNWLIENLPEHDSEFLNNIADIYYSDSRLDISRSGHATLIRSFSAETDEEGVTHGFKEYCNGSLDAGGLNINLTLTCVVEKTYEYNNFVSEFIGDVSYDITGTLDFDDILLGSLTNLTAQKNNIEEFESDIYISLNPSTAGDSERNNYSAWLEEKFPLDGLYYEGRWGKSAAILVENGEASVIDTSGFIPSSYWSPASEETQEALNSECDIEISFETPDYQWFENTDNADLQFNIAAIADADINIANCYDSSYGESFTYSFKAVMTFYQDSNSFTYNNKNYDFSQSQSFGANLVSMDDRTPSQSAQIGFGMPMICYKGEISSFNLWLEATYGVIFFLPHPDATKDDLEVFCSQYS